MKILQIDDFIVPQWFVPRFNSDKYRGSWTIVVVVVGVAVFADVVDVFIVVAVSVSVVSRIGWCSRWCS